MAGRRYRAGAHNVIDDRTGFKIKSTEARKEWNGLVVRRKSYEERHPQEFVRGRRDDQTVQNPRSEPADDFLTPNEAHDALLDTAFGSVSATATPDGGNTGDGSVNELAADLSASQSGSYTLRITKTSLAAATVQDAGNNGEIRLDDPNGNLVDYGEMNTLFHGGGLEFKVEEDGSTAFAIGDKFTITVS